MSVCLHVCLSQSYSAKKGHGYGVGMGECLTAAASGPVICQQVERCLGGTRKMRKCVHNSTSPWQDSVGSPAHWELRCTLYRPRAGAPHWRCNGKKCGHLKSRLKRNARSRDRPIRFATSMEEGRGYWGHVEGGGTFWLLAPRGGPACG